MAAWGRLRVLDGAHEGTVFILEREVHTLGRGQASDFRLADPTVSRVQVEFRTTPEGVRISGLSDKNPVWVNGEPAGRGRPLVLGDKVQCGLVHLVFEEPPPPPPAGAEPPLSTRGLAMTTSGLSSLESIPAAPAAPGGPEAGPRGPACTRCGAKEAPGARFCGSCGAALAGSVPLRTTSVTRVPAPPPLQPTVSPSALTPMAPLRAPAYREDLPPPPVRTDTMARPPEVLDSVDAPFAAHRGAAAPSPGTVLKGRFELRRHIAQGRVTEVYEGFDRETRTSVTVKVLLPSLASDLEVRDWFFHAANALIVAAHPRLLKVHSVHESGQTCFAVTDLLAGVPLRDQIRSRPASMGGFDPGEVRRVGTSLCEGLAKLHEVGPHGDVVPGNVWMDPQGKVTLLDAGLSAAPGKAVRWPPSSDLASAVYSAPEVLRGAPPDARSDLYSVGAILYHMLTADLPAGRISSVAAARPGLPPDLAGAVDRAMSPRPGDRFASAEEMLRFLTGELETRRRTGLRKRYIAAAAAVVVLAVAASSAFWFSPAEAWRRKSFADPAAVAQAEARRAEALAAEEALKPLAEFTSPDALGTAREAVRRGDAARGDWLPVEAEREYMGALTALRREGKAAQDAKNAREEALRRAAASAQELEHEIGNAAPAGEFLGTAAAEFDRRAKAEVPSAGEGTVLSRVESAERRAALEKAGEMALGLQRTWEKFASEGDTVRRARKDQQESAGLLAEGRTAKSDTHNREGVLRLRRGIGEQMESLLRKICAEARIPEPPEAEQARRALADVTHLGSTGDPQGAAEAFDLALAGFADVVGKALESVRAAAEEAEKGKRCPECAGEGACRACGGTGRAMAECKDCAGKGVLDAPCTKCDADGMVPCGECEAGFVKKKCEVCNGGKTVPCSRCGGKPAPCSNPRCKDGRVPCLYCKNGVVTAAGTDKGKPCTHGCDKGWSKCPKCAGKGTAPCEACKGEGREPCKACDGDGSKPWPCGTCSGKGKVRCLVCSGTRVIHPDCPKCEGGSVLSDCPACGGRKACPACSGRGTKQ